jgi:hypothetical protein
LQHLQSYSDHVKLCNLLYCVGDHLLALCWRESRVFIIIGNPSTWTGWFLVRGCKMTFIAHYALLWCQLLPVSHWTDGHFSLWPTNLVYIIGNDNSMNSPAHCSRK